VLDRARAVVWVRNYRYVTIFILVNAVYDSVLGLLYGVSRLLGIFEEDDCKPKPAQFSSVLNCVCNVTAARCNVTAARTLQHTHCSTHTVQHIADTPSHIHCDTRCNTHSNTHCNKHCNTHCNTHATVMYQPCSRASK